MAEQTLAGHNHVASQHDRFPGSSVVPDILIVEQDSEHCRDLAAYLGLNGYIVHSAVDPKAMDRVLKRESVGVVILDSHLPNGSGLPTCRRLAEMGGPPVIMMGSGEDQVDRIVGLEVGADDYIAKDVNPRELLARIRVAMRRGEAQVRTRPAAAYVSRGFELDVFRRQLRAPGGEVLRLTPTEVAMLTVFLDRRGEPVSRADLKELALRDDKIVLDRAVDTQVSRLRRKLSAYAGVDLIQSVYGLGYVWDAGYGLSTTATDRDASRPHASVHQSLGAP
jgi:two-component system OmpR family response regulator